MTLASQRATAGPFACDGVQVEFPFEFRVEEAEHLRVYKDDLPVESGYTVRLLENGGSVVFAAAPAAGSAVAVERNVPTTQEVDLQNNTAFLPEVLEGALDKLTMICQQLQSRLARSMVLPPTRTETDETIYSWFLELSENAERWAREAQSGAATAKVDATKAKNSADEAYLSKLTAVEAAESAGRAEAETGSMRGEVARMYDDSSLNRAHLVFGEWGTLEGMYINYEDWTDTETLIGLTAALAAHNADGSAHPGFAKKTEVESARNSAVSEARMPAGCVTAFAGSGTVPAGWFVCDGREVSRGEHPELFAAIGVTYGDGDGSTTFNLPDFRGRFLRGYLGELSGEIGAEQAEGLPDVDLALRMDNPNVRANVKAAPRMDEAVYGSDGYAVTDTTGTDEYMIRQSDLIDREKAGLLVKSAVYGRSEHVTPMNFAVQWIIKN